MKARRRAGTALRGSRGRRSSATIWSATSRPWSRTPSGLFITNSDDNGKGNPANPVSSPAIEMRAEIRREFSLAKITGNKDGYGPFKDLFLAGEYNAGMKETPALGHTNTFRLGVGAELPVPVGAAAITLFMDKEYDFGDKPFGQGKPKPHRKGPAPE
jgi:hypothetical protein